MLSDLVNQHPGALSLSEFFACLDPGVFPAGQLDGPEFWKVLGTPRLKPNVLMSRGVTVPEYRYPIGSGRYAAGAVPALSLMTLPPLTKDPDALYDRLRDEVTGWSAASISGHYLRLFSWWAAASGRDVVVERSGASLRFLPDLLAHFPAARFVHMYRNGPDAAVSMSRHPLFRLGVLIGDMRAVLGVDPYRRPDPGHTERLPEELRPFAPDSLDAAALAGADIPLARFGDMWSRANRALRHLAELPPERLLHLSYNDVVADPVPHLTAFGRFAGLAGPEEWASRVVGQVDGRRPGAASRLSEREAEELRLACAPGDLRLAEFLGT
ncbi:sulfotransferase family protein [Streptomyces sp. NPDC003327]